MPSSTARRAAYCLSALFLSSALTGQTVGVLEVGPGPATRDASSVAAAASAPGGPFGNVEVPNGGILLIPDSTNDRVMAFDAETGLLINADFIPADSTHLNTPKNAVADPGRHFVYVSDQLNDVVQRYSFETGEFLGTAAGPDLSKLDNLTGVALQPDGSLLVCVTGGTNADTVARFSANGSYLGNLVAAGAGGLDGPFDILAASTGYLVSADTSDAIHRYAANGTASSNLASINTFPEQLARAANGNLLVANFSGTQEGIVELNAAGTVVGISNPTETSGYRGVWELPNDHYLVTTASGVHEIDRDDNFVATRQASASGQYIEYVPPRGNYRLTTSSFDPACAVPFSHSDGEVDAYYDLEASGFFTDPTLFGDDVVFDWVLPLDDSDFDTRQRFYGANVGRVVKIHTNGFVFFEPGTPGAGIANVPSAFPNPAAPNNLLAPFWRDLVVTYDAGTNKGISRAVYQSSGSTFAWIVEFDDAKIFPGGGSDHVDFEVYGRLKPSDAEGDYEFIFAYDNLVGQTGLNLGIGIEPAMAEQGTTFHYSSSAAPLPVTDGMAICFDWELDLLFADSFELGDSRLWSATHN